MESKHRIETVAVHAGHTVDAATGAVTAPIQLSTTFERAIDGSYPSGHVYSRSGNPNRQALERAISQIEGGADAAAFASGLAAASAIFQSLAPGDHVLMATETYHGTAKLARDLYHRWGLDITFADLSDLNAAKAAFRKNTKLVWVETPSNPLLTITDIAAIADAAHNSEALCVCDNTLAPILQRPLDFGADLVMHSTTKYIGGHSDVIGGIVVTREKIDCFDCIRDIQGSAGAVPSPFDCWLVLRGLRSLPCRIRLHSENAMRVAEFLETHPRVQSVRYPGLPTHARHEIAARQMTAFSGIVSFRVKGDAATAIAVSTKTRLFTRATSLGGVESLIEHRASVPGEDPRTPANLLRLSVGLENASDLIEDLDQALS